MIAARAEIVAEEEQGDLFPDTLPEKEEQGDLFEEEACATRVTRITAQRLMVLGIAA
ncbi:MAG: hypothetical protein JO126_04760 [Alphaproteobacteria bacterium]|nr:hypothetical protein [Alphaproteobacteria bacterium]MBV8548749.1 hypothetical protein [Alphaproteobacteria bacterium]